MIQIMKAKPATGRVPILAKLSEAKDVRVTGDFNQWDADGIRLSCDGAGTWRTMLPLAPGEYQYRLLVDGRWADHAEADARVPNAFGTENCVLKVV